MTKQLPDPTLTWLFFGFSGRIGRRSFALSVLFQFVLMFLAVYWAVQAKDDPIRLTISGFAFIGVMFFTLWSILALTIKRLHDLNLPAALSITVFIPAVTWLALAFLMLKPGHNDANEHGPPPFGVR